MADPSSWKLNTFPCPKDWPHPAHRWTKHHRPGTAEAVRCPGISDALASDSTGARKGT